MPGPNVIANPSFDNGLIGHEVAVAGGATITAIPGAAVIDRLIGTTAVLYSDYLVVGAPYLVTVAIAEVIGTVSIQIGTGSTIRNYSQPGIHQFEGVSGADTLFRTFASAASKATISFISARRLDQNMSRIVLTMRDYDGDKKATSIDLGPVTDGASYVTREGQAAAIRDAVNAVAGNVASYQFLAQDAEPNDINAATPDIQAHNRWVVEFVDSVTGDGPYRFFIPTADLGNADLFLPSSNQHDPAAAEWIALKAAMNGIAINYRTGSTMNITAIYLEE